MRLLMKSLAVGSLFLLGGCLDPLTGDEAGYSPHIRSNQDTIPSISEDASLTAQVDGNDQVQGGTIALQRGWYDGTRVRYWDFGESPPFAVPVWLFRTCDESGASTGRIPGHPNVIDVIPGDLGYTPLWTMIRVCVNPGFEDLVFPSADAINDAVELGYVRPPIETGMWANCPVYLPSMQLDVGGGAAPVLPEEGFYQGVRAYYYHPGKMEHGMFPLNPDGMPAYNYVLQASLSDGTSCEPVFSVDRNDSGNPDDAYDLGYSPLAKIVEVDYAPGATCPTRFSDELTETETGFTTRASDIEKVTVSDTLWVLDVQHTFGGA